VASGGSQSVFPKCLAQLHPTRETPVRALWFVSFITSIWIWIGDFTQLANVVMFLVWIIYLMTTVGLLRLRRILPNAPRAFRVWTPIAVLFCMVAMFLIVAPLMSNGDDDDNHASSIWMHLACIAGVLLVIPIYWMRKALSTTSGYRRL
jgi:amino acid transporter